MSINFDEEYFTEIGYKDYSDRPHFLARAVFIKDILQPKDGVIVLGGAMGYTAYHLEQLGVDVLNLETSPYCYDNRVTESFETDITKVQWNKFDWIVSWSVLDCLNDSNVDVVCTALNGFETVFKGKQLHVFSCDNNDNSADYIADGYFIKSHDYWKTKLPTANLVCWDCKQVIQGDIHHVPIGLGVSD